MNGYQREIISEPEYQDALLLGKNEVTCAQSPRAQPMAAIPPEHPPGDNEERLEEEESDEYDSDVIEVCEGSTFS